MSAPLQPLVDRLLLGLLANWLIFLWVIARLPRQHVTLRSAVQAALFGAVGFEALKVIMTYYLSSVTASPSGAVCGSFLGLLVFVFFASRFVLFVTAWAATARENEQEEPVPVPEPPVLHSQVVVRGRPTGGSRRRSARPARAPASSACRRGGLAHSSKAARVRTAAQIVAKRAAARQA